MFAGGAAVRACPGTGGPALRSPRGGAGERGVDGGRVGHERQLIQEVDAEFHEDPHFPESGVYRGRAAIAAYSTQFQDAWADFDYELRDTFEAGDRVVAVLHIRGQGKSSGATLDLETGWVWTIRERQAVRCDAYLHLDEALEAVGLRE